MTTTAVKPPSQYSSTNIEKQTEAQKGIKTCHIQSPVMELGAPPMKNKLQTQKNATTFADLPFSIVSVLKNRLKLGRALRPQTGHQVYAHCPRRNRLSSEKRGTDQQPRFSISPRGAREEIAN
ncbi:MAG: hypothetical protein HS126_00045 [Anaerolineales bacterium]|nr:hypothetical protein [Anaerolineales bacterium]